MTKRVEIVDEGKYSVTIKVDGVEVRGARRYEIRRFAGEMPTLRLEYDMTPLRYAGDANVEVVLGSITIRGDDLSRFADAIGERAGRAIAPWLYDGAGDLGPL